MVNVPGVVARTLAPLILIDAVPGVTGSPPTPVLRAVSLDPLLSGKDDMLGFAVAGIGAGAEDEEASRDGSSSFWNNVDCVTR